ncbi:MAG: hypothetical protein KUA33_09810 [Methanobacterium sp.]|nr:hypothetical protein [Methanobacterium sp.]MBV1754225.1 hypothetical protein [Methanobacterium sp.]MBV1767126.1 hypothetical protein [Methanobacterium sp.]
MAIKYIYDSKGKKTDVIIPIDLWNRNKSTILKNNQKKDTEKVFKPSKYRGIYKDMKLDLEKEARNLRKEWERT